MKKKKRIILVIAIFAVVVGAAVFLAGKYMKTYPEKTAYSMSSTSSYSDDGLYFVKNNMLNFYDNKAGSSVIVCNKPNCEHDTAGCNAYIDGIATEVMCYGSNVYVSILANVSDSDDNSDEPGVLLVQIDRSGNNRKTIYSSDTGAVLSLKAIDDKLFFTSYIFPVMKDDSEYYEYYDNYLYVYDLRWNRLKMLKKFEGTDDFYAGIVSIQRTEQKDKVYINAEYYKKSDMTGDPEEYIDRQKHSIYCYDVKLKNIEHVKDMGADFYMYGQLAGRDVVVYKNAFTDKFSIDQCDAQLNEGDTLCQGTGSLVILDGYIYIMNTDYKKALYDYVNDKYYIANTTFSESGKYISDVYAIDRDRDIIYVDMHDYTGMKPGDVFYEDVSDKSCQSLQEFIKENFTTYDELESEQKKSVNEWFEMDID